MLGGSVGLLLANLESGGPGGVRNGALIWGNLHDVGQILPIVFLVRLAEASDSLALEATARDFGHPVARQGLLAVVGETSIRATDKWRGRTPARLVLAPAVTTVGDGSASSLGVRHMALILLRLLLGLLLWVVEALRLRGALEHGIGCKLSRGRILAGLRVVVQRDTDGTAVVTVVLADDLLGVQLPEASIVIRAGRDEIGRVGTKGAVPDPALVAGKRGLQGPGLGLVGIAALLLGVAVGIGRSNGVGSDGRVVETVRRCSGRSGGIRLNDGDLGVGVNIGNHPDLGRVVSRACGHLLDIGRQQDACDGLLVGREVGDGDEVRLLDVLDKGPNKDVALHRCKLGISEGEIPRVEAYDIVGSTEKSAIAGNSDTAEADILLGDELVAAVVLRQVPNANTASAIAADDLALVGVDHDIVDRAAVVVTALDVATSGLPNLDGAILGRGDHPLALAVEGHARDVARVTLEGEKGVGVGRFDVVQLDRVMAGGGEVALVRRDTQSVDLGVGVLDGTRADAGEGLPEPGPGQVSNTPAPCFTIGSIGKGSKSGMGRVCRGGGGSRGQP